MTNIMNPNAESLFIVSLKATRMMYSTQGWSSENVPEEMVFIDKRVSSWEDGLLPVMHDIVKNHEVPEFAKEVTAIIANLIQAIGIIVLAK